MPERSAPGPDRPGSGDPGPEHPYHEHPGPHPDRADQEHTGYNEPRHDRSDPGEPDPEPNPSDRPDQPSCKHSDHEHPGHDPEPDQTHPEEPDSPPDRTGRPTALTRTTVQDLLDRHGLAPSRALGQNFVVDPNTVRRIAYLAGVGPGDRVIEIGAGLGSLTLALVEAGAEVTAVEIDRHLLPALRSVVEPVGVTVVHGDALTLDWDGLLGAGRGDADADGGPVTGVANLPYNVGTQIVLHLLESVPAIDRMLVMVQREVAERLAAPAGDPAYGIPSVKVAWWASAQVVGRVPPSVFLPRPRVESALVDIRRHDGPPVAADRRKLFSLVDTAFGQRRKMLRRSLAGVLSSEDIAAAGVSPEARPETLALQHWAALTRMTE